MARIPYDCDHLGESIDLHADPVPLLDEIVQCVSQGIAVRPVLAAWLADAHRSDRITVKGLRGRPIRELFSMAGGDSVCGETVR